MRQNATKRLKKKTGSKTSSALERLAEMCCFRRLLWNLWKLRRHQQKQRADKKKHSAHYAEE